MLLQRGEHLEWEELAAAAAGVEADGQLGACVARSEAHVPVQRAAHAHVAGVDQHAEQALLVVDRGRRAAERAGAAERADHVGVVRAAAQERADQQERRHGAERQLDAPQAREPVGEHVHLVGPKVAGAPVEHDAVRGEPCAFGGGHGDAGDRCGGGWRREWALSFAARQRVRMGPRAVELPVRWRGAGRPVHRRPPVQCALAVQSTTIQLC